MNAGDRSREYKKSEAFIYQGVDYARVIATRIYDSSFKNTLREFARFIAYDYQFSFSPSEGNVLCVYSYRGKGRIDYDAIVDGFCGFLDHEVDQYEFIYRFMPFMVFRKTPNLIKCLLILKKKKVRKPLFPSIVMAQFMHYKARIEKDVDFKKYKLCVTFCDAHGVENLFAQLEKAHNVATATLQHGQYRVLKRETENADVESYENFISDYLLAWGRKTADEFEKAGIERSRVIPVGAIKPFSKNNRLVPHEFKNVFGVALDGNIYEESNVAMIGIANKLAKDNHMKYILRLHPKNVAEKYLKLCDKEVLLESINRIENKEYAERVDFSLVHMTGVFVELLSINSAMFIFKDKFTESIYEIEDATFSTEDELTGLLVKYREDQSALLDRQYALYHEFNQPGEISQNYKNAIKQIISSDCSKEA